MGESKPIAISEFKALFDKLKTCFPDTRAKDLCPLFDVSEAGISYWMSGRTPAPMVVLEKMRSYVAQMCLDDPSVLKESTPETETEVWKRRAKTAERELHELRQRMRAVLEPSPAASSSSTSIAVAESMLDTALVEASKLQQKRGAGVPTVQIPAPSPAALTSPVPRISPPKKAPK